MQPQLKLNIFTGKITWHAVELQQPKGVAGGLQDTRFTPWTQKRPHIKMEGDRMFCACVRAAAACETLSNSWPGGLEGEQLEYQCCITLGYLIQWHNPPHYQEISERIFPFWLLSRSKITAAPTIADCKISQLSLNIYFWKECLKDSSYVTADFLVPSGAV